MIKIAYYLEKFLEILTVEKNLAKNSLIAYQTDLEDFVRFIQENNHNISQELIAIEQVKTKNETADENVEEWLNR